MDDYFEDALSCVLKNEGGYSDDPNDPGGETKFGITEKDLKQYGDLLKIPLDVKKLTVDDARKFYKKIYWDQYHYNLIDSLPIVTKVFDMAVNMGARRAHIFLQKALYDLRLEIFPEGYLKIDGIIGRETEKSIEKIISSHLEEKLINKLRAYSIQYYADIVEERPRLHCFLKGWLKRAQE